GKIGKAQGKGQAQNTKSESKPQPKQPDPKQPNSIDDMMDKAKTALSDAGPAMNVLTRAHGILDTVALLIQDFPGTAMLDDEVAEKLQDLITYLVGIREGASTAAITPAPDGARNVVH